MTDVGWKIALGLGLFIAIFALRKGAGGGADDELGFLRRSRDRRRARRDERRHPTPPEGKP